MNHVLDAYTVFVPYIVRKYTVEIEEAVSCALLLLTRGAGTVNGRQSTRNVVQTNCSSLFWAKYPRFRQNHLCKPHWTFRVTIDFPIQPYRTMKTKTWICLILSGLVLFGISAHAGGAQCAAAAKEAAAKANVDEETKEEATATTLKAPVVEEEALALTTSEASLDVSVVTDFAIEVELSPESVEVPVVVEVEPEVDKSSSKDSKKEVVEESK